MIRQIENLNKVDEIEIGGYFYIILVKFAIPKFVYRFQWDNLSFIKI